jgi:DNA-binding transcriptional MerR regulator
VIRFWESEFPQFRKDGATGGPRVYRKEDIDLVRRIKQLLYEEEYTLAGARERLEQEMGDGPTEMAGRALGRAADAAPDDAAERRPPRPAPRPLAVARDAASVDTVARDRYDRAVEEIELLRLKLKEAEAELRRAESARAEADARSELDRDARRRAAERVQAILARLGTDPGAG